jgi:alkyl hydroperoxide reductase subunit AhpF
MGLLNDQDTAFLRKRFADDMVHDVRLVFFAPSLGGIALPGNDDAEMAEYTLKILKEVTGLSDRIALEEHSLATEPQFAAEYGVSRTPATAILGAVDYGVRYYGIPAGYEFATLIDVILDVSRGTAPVSAATTEALASLPGDAHLQVFVTPT